jgi:hypothetical protein
MADDLRKAESWCELDGVLNRYETVKNLYKMGYRKQSENVIELPCKVEQEAYVISPYFTGNWEIYEGKVTEITIYSKNTFIRIIAKGNFKFGENVENIGKTVFFTKEEAEEALAKMKGGAE